MTSSQRYRSNCNIYLTDIFRDLASDESFVELRRQDLSRNPDFEPYKAFCFVDGRGIGKVDATDFLELLRKNYISATLSECHDMIKEYDASGDGALDFYEFSQLVLPATNCSLRSIAEGRRYATYFRASEPLSYNSVNLLVRLVEKELGLQRRRNENKLRLQNSPDFIKVRTFNDIAGHHQQINLSDLTRYLQSNGFWPRHEDIEAILRRLDHDANQMISYAEFCEVASIGNPNTDPSSPDKEDSPIKSRAGGSQAKSFVSPSKEETKEPVDRGTEPVKKFYLSEENSQSKVESLSPEKQNSAAKQSALKEREKINQMMEDERRRYEDQRVAQEEERKLAIAKREQEIKELMEKREEEQLKRNEEIKEERERREQERLKCQQEYKEKRQREQQEYEANEVKRKEDQQKRSIENLMFLRLVKNILYQQRQVETLRQTLFSHKAFSVSEAFRAIDQNQSGQITADEIQSIFDANSIDTRDPHRIIELFDSDNDKQISFGEFQQMVTPLKRPYRDMVGGSYGSVEERRLQQLSWLESLNDLFQGILRAEDDLDYYREKYQLDGERIFQDIDAQRIGYFYMNRFANWVSDNCGFTVNDEDLTFIQEGLSSGNSHCIRKEDFLQRVNANDEDDASESEIQLIIQPNVGQRAPESSAAEAHPKEEPVFNAEEKYEAVVHEESEDFLQE